MASKESEDAEWKCEAEKEQIIKGQMFNKMDICELDVLRTRLAICLYGLPEKIQKNPKEVEFKMLSYNQYQKKKQDVVVKLSQCILQYQETSDENKIYVGFVLVLGRTKNRKPTNFQDWVIKVPGKDGNKVSFIDRNCRVYKDWDDYLKNNTLPKATICYPANGKYADEESTVQVDYANTPACSVAKNVLFGFDIATSITTIAGCGLATASLFVPIAAPFVWTAFGVTAASGVYSAGRSIESLVDRGKHNETLSFFNTNARSAWLGATVPFFGLAAGGATAIAATARVTNLGVSLSQSGRMAINISNGVNCVAQGVCFVNDVYNIIETSINGNEISVIQIFQCVASLLLFANAVVSTHQARLILQSLSSQEKVGGMENLYGKLSQSITTENGVIVRPTTFIAMSDLKDFISIAISWGGLFLNVPPTICKSIEKILHYLEKSRDTDFLTVVIGLLPLLKELWEIVYNQTKNHSYEYQWPTSNNRSCIKINPSIKVTDTTEKISENFKSATSDNSQTEFLKEDSDKITIVDMLWDGEKQPFQNLIQNMFEKEDISELDLLQYSQFVFQRLTEDLEDMEKHFEMTCQYNPDFTEKELENKIGIKGKRSQYFANEIMKSYRDVKIVELKQECQRLMEERGIQVPLYSSCVHPMKVLYYHSNQKKGTKTEKYLKILQEANINTHHTCNTYFPSKNACFVKLNDDNSKYNMAGIINFAGDNDMMGIIILVEKI